MVKRRVGLESVGELLYNVTSDEERYQHVPKDLDHIAPADLRELSSVLRTQEQSFEFQEKKSPIEGL